MAEAKQGKGSREQEAGNKETKIKREAKSNKQKVIRTEKTIKKVKEQKNGTTKKSGTVAAKAISTAKEKVNSKKQSVKSKKNDSVAPEAGSAQVNESLAEPETTKASNDLTKPIAKAGRRSAKALKEAEEKEAKESRKAAKSIEASTDDGGKPVHHHKARTAEDRLKARSKNYRKVYEKVDRTKAYGLSEALALAAKTSPVKFDATVELHIRLNVDPKQADQNVRDIVVLPSGTGRNVRIAVFADGTGVTAAKKAGADIAAADEFLQQLDKGTLDFDVLISTPANMPKLGKYARLLGPKGLMPNPKSGTVTNDITKAVTEAKAGRVEYRVDSTGIVHLGIGKVSFGDSKLQANAQAVLGSIKGNKPASIKSTYVRSIFVSTTMGPSIQIETQAAQ